VVAKKVTGGSSPGVYWFLSDHLGSLQGVLDGNGAAISRRTYRPYGQTLGQSGSHTESRGWIDQRNDAETGLTYLHARYFDPQLGVFLSPDPIGVEGGLSQYAYALGNPTAMTDRSGLYASSCVEGYDALCFKDTSVENTHWGEFYALVSHPGNIFAAWGNPLAGMIGEAFDQHRAQLAVDGHGTLFTIYDANGTAIGMSVDPSSTNEELCRANSAACTGGRTLTNLYFSQETGVVLAVGTRDLRMQVADVTVSRYGGSLSFGHAGLAVGGDPPVGYYPVEGPSKGFFLAGNSAPGVVSRENRTPVDSVTLHTTPQQDAALRALVRGYQRDPRAYNFYTNNCAQVTTDLLRAAGINVPRTANPALLLWLLRGMNAQ
jgi:RHS repeat-associated protein